MHLTDFPSIPAPGVDALAWERLMRVREAVNALLERARSAKQIGAFLEADIQLHGDPSTALGTGFTLEALTGGLAVDLAKLFIVSHVECGTDSPVRRSDGLENPSHIDFIDIDGFGRVGITMSPARGKKCGRCWQYRDEVTEEGGLCARCEEVVAGLAPAEAPTA